jgi:uncharacterized protein
MSASPKTSPWVFFLLVFLLSVPFWLLGATRGRLPVPIFLPISALMAFTPMIAALVLVYRDDGADGAMGFLKRAFDFGRVQGMGWYVVALFLMPIVFVLEYGVLRLTGAALPVPHITLGETLIFFAMFFVGAIGEELGWQGYAFSRLKTRWSALEVAMLLGVFWALWHVIPFVQMGRSADWIFWQCLCTVALRVITVWLFVNTGQSVFIAILFHTMYNVTWGLFPNYGSHYDPFVTFVILALATGMIIALCGPATLARFRYARSTTD